MTDAYRSYGADRHLPNKAGVGLSAGHQAMLRYLARNRVIPATAASDYETRIVDWSRSHGVWSLRLRDGRHLIVKRARPRPGELHGNIGTELAVYGLSASIAELGDAVPACVWIDPRMQVLVLRAVEPGDNLHHFNYTHGPATDHTRKLGENLARWHRATREIGHLNIGSSYPWILDIFVPGRWRPRHTDQLLKHRPIRHELARHFADVAGRLKPDCLIHGDMKWDNCLTMKAGIKVIDWEAAGFGDAAWDLAGILQEFVVYPEVVPTDRACGDDHLERCLTVFLNAYQETNPHYDRQEFLNRAARLAGARLIQTALEYTASSGHFSTAQALVCNALECMRNPQRLINGSIRVG